MAISTDAYGSETTWEVTGPGGSPVYGSGGPYSNQSAAGEFPQPDVSFCVPDNSIMEITVEDSYGDGMCCAYGEGSWAIIVNGVTVASGGEFATVETAEVALGTDLGIAQVGVASVIAAGTTQITGTVSNNGTNAVSGFTLSYAIDGGTPLSQTFSNNIPAGGSYAFTHSTPWNATVGPHTLAINLSGVSNDMISSNNSYSGPVNVATQSATRTTVLEQFTSSTCPPCASLNVTFAPMLTGLSTNHGSNFAAVKYHMNWPPPGNDPSYNPDGNSRRGYYGVTGIPDLYLDGAPMPGTGASVMQAAQAKPAFVDLQAQALINGPNLTVQTTLTPFADFPGAHKLHIAVTEDSYDYAASTTNQDQFHYVMRKMLPNASGTTLAPLTAGVSQNFNPEYTFTIGGPAQGNYNLWTGMDNLSIVAFVQNTSTKEVLQGTIASVVVGLDEHDGDIRFGLYPNPTNSSLTMDFDMPKTGVAQFEVYDQMGKLVHAKSMSAAAGAQRGTMDLQHLDNGLYHVTLVVDGARSTRKVLVNK